MVKVGPLCLCPLSGESCQTPPLAPAGIVGSSRSLAACLNIPGPRHWSINTPDSAGLACSTHGSAHISAGQGYWGQWDTKVTRSHLQLPHKLHGQLCAKLGHGSPHSSGGKDSQPGPALGPLTLVPHTSPFSSSLPHYCSHNPLHPIPLPESSLPPPPLLPCPHRSHQVLVATWQEAPREALGEGLGGHASGTGQAMGVSAPVSWPKDMGPFVPPLTCGTLCH